MKQRMSAIALAVSDLAKAKAFYVDGLGWKPVFEGDDIAFFQMNGFIFALFVKDSFEKDMNRPITLGGGANSLATNVEAKEDVDAAIAEALAAGATLLKAAADTEWGGRSGYVADPDGHVWEIAWNPFWPISEEGYVTIPV